MITQNWLEIGPAYGRDYKSAKDAKADFLNGKDFENLSRLQTGGGTYCSIRDFAPGTSVILRYKRNTMTTTVKVPHYEITDPAPHPHNWSS